MLEKVCSFMLWLLSIHAGAAEIEAEESQCGLYFAPSTIPGAGYGMFAGRFFEMGEQLSPGDIPLPIVELTWNNNDRRMYWLFEEYVWASDIFPGMSEEAEAVSVLSFGIGAIPNCFFPMINAKDSLPQMGTARLHRGEDPGAGAFTPYHDRQGHATRDIEAGEEIFVDYGPNYFPAREKEYGLVPDRTDYEAVDALLRSYTRIKSRIASKTKSSACLYEDLLYLVQSVDSIWPSRILKALPDDALVFEEAAEIGMSKMFRNQTRRDLDWLEENGSCMDNIRAGRSTIGQAGRGAFAARSIRAGTVVSPVPLVHIANRTQLVIYRGIYDENGDFVRDTSSPMHYQLLLNYCFGHRYSSLLLCPYGVLTGLVNHSKEKANAKIEWSRTSSRQLDWLQKPPEEWVKSKFAGLAFDFVATRHIEEGEEILIDYGDEWEAAWNKQVAKWKPPRGAESYSPAYELDFDIDLVVRTVDEGPYPAEEVTLLCRGYYSLKFQEYEDEGKDQVYECRALFRPKGSDGVFHYVAEIYSITVDHDVGMCLERHEEILWDVPRDAFCFEDTFYS